MKFFFSPFRLFERQQHVQLGVAMPEKNLVAVGHEKAPIWLQAIKIGAVSLGGFKLSIRATHVGLVRGLAYPWPVAPQQSRRPFQLISLASIEE